MGSLTGAVASKRVTEAYKGQLSADGNRAVSANAKAGLTARLVGLAVKPAFTFILIARFPTALSRPLNASVTFLEATAPVKLPT